MHAVTLADILHVKQVSATSHQVEASGVTGLPTAGQQAKLVEIDALVAEIGDPTIDEELDAIIVALTEIRDRV